MLKEFRDFIMTGNVVDLAVAVILAGAVGLVVTGFTNDMIMPIVGHFTGGIDFADMKYVLDPAVIGPDGVVAKPENAIMYGKWINALINLIIVGLSILIIRLNIINGNNKKRRYIRLSIQSPRDKSCSNPTKFK